jgi:hypothetical protein
MLTKLADTVSFRLLPLFSILFIAVGMPVLHPVLHSHSENHGIIPEYCDQHISAFTDENHEPNCLICDFLATSQLYDTGMEPVKAEIKPADKIISLAIAFLAKSHPLQIVPRAPPSGHSS